MAEHRAKASGRLSTDDDALPGLPPPANVSAVNQSDLAGRMQAVINCHGCNLRQIEVAILTNQHEIDPHPLRQGAYVIRHPVILAAFDTSQVDEDGNPAEGKPAELNMKAIREIFSARYPHVSADPPPRDGSHIQVDGMHIVAELDHMGQPTGRVRVGNAEDVRS